MISKVFPKTHPLAAKTTEFASYLRSRIKIHTIRGNYDLWEKRINEIINGKAYLSVREWSGKPYRSKQKELFQFHKDIGIQKLINEYEVLFVGTNRVEVITLANNDGLSSDEFDDWFRKYPKNLRFKKYPVEPQAIIHFTKFRY